jgi:hypothetical protein
MIAKGSPPATPTAAPRFFGILICFACNELLLSFIFLHPAFLGFSRAAKSRGAYQQKNRAITEPPKAT